MPIVYCDDVDCKWEEDGKCTAIAIFIQDWGYDGMSCNGFDHAPLTEEELSG